MCLLVVLSRVIPEWPLIVAANRDERYERPALGVDLLRSSPPRTLGGKDLRAGGTWLALNEHGVFAGLTNQPAPEGVAPGRRSRGEIPLALTTAASAPVAVDEFVRSGDASAFNPCWVLVGDRNSCYYLELTHAGPAQATELAPGVHVLENNPLGDRSGKVDRVKQILGDVHGRPGDDVLRLLKQVLRDHTLTRPGVAGDEQSQRAAQISSCCVHTDDYGTRSSMLLRDPRDAGALPQVWASDGPSCQHAFTTPTFS